MSNGVVVGAGRGIGLELVRILLSKGHRLVVLTRHIEELPTHENLKPLFFDLEEPLKPEDPEDQVKSFLPNLDFMVNNAGYLVNKPFQKISSKELMRSYQVNVIGVFQSIQRLLPLLKKGSHIVNISSMGGVQGTVKFPGLTAYSSSKAALCGLTEILAEELREKEVAVNCLALGAVQTEMLEEAFPGYKAPLTAIEMADYIADFTIKGHQYYNGKILPLANSTP